MKEICEEIFCFWRKWCNKKYDSLVSIEETKMLDNNKENDSYSNIKPSVQIKSNTFENHIETEMSTALPL